ncbi:hypothetical protein J6590_022590 [Homalodisca vitripennis]|nr:hypothetical protein J6590_022590 [Homalodisca vitripennis]
MDAQPTHLYTLSVRRTLVHTSEVYTCTTRPKLPDFCSTVRVYDRRELRSEPTHLYTLSVRRTLVHTSEVYTCTTRPKLPDFCSTVRVYDRRELRSEPTHLYTLSVRRTLVHTSEVYTCTTRPKLPDFCRQLECTIGESCEPTHLYTLSVRRTLVHTSEVYTCTTRPKLPDFCSTVRVYDRRELRSEPTHLYTLSVRRTLVHTSEVYTCTTRPKLPDFLSRQLECTIGESCEVKWHNGRSAYTPVHTICEADTYTHLRCTRVQHVLNCETSVAQLECTIGESCEVKWHNGRSAYTPVHTICEADTCTHIWGLHVYNTS